MARWNKLKNEGLMHFRFFDFEGLRSFLENDFTFYF